MRKWNVFQPTPTYDSVGDSRPRPSTAMPKKFQPTPTYDSVGDGRVDAVTWLHENVSTHAHL